MHPHEMNAQRDPPSKASQSPRDEEVEIEWWVIYDSFTFGTGGIRHVYTQPSAGMLEVIQSWGGGAGERANDVAIIAAQQCKKQFSIQLYRMCTACSDASVQPTMCNYTFSDGQDALLIFMIKCLFN